MANLKLTRDQLASFLSDFEQIKQFEKLFGQTNENTDAIEGELQMSIGIASTAANEANARIETLFQSLLKEPAPEKNNSIFTDYIDLAESGPHVRVKRRMAWNATDQTLDVGMDWDVTQQVGLETYARVQNSTGSDIPNGTVVGFGGVGPGGVISIVPFIANGTMPAQYAGGVMTHDLPDSGQIGYATIYGHVRTLDTSAFSVGDVVYASATVAGALTNVRPTAPNIVVIIGVVLIDDAVDGEIFVRPTFDIQTFYATFVKTTDQSPAAINTAYALTFDSALIANGFSIGAPTSRLVAAHAGLYLVSANVQITSTSASVKNIWFWLRKNGADVPNTTRLVTVDLNNGYVSGGFVGSISLVINDYVEVIFAADSTAVTIDAVAATAFAPASAAATITFSQIAQ